MAIAQTCVCIVGIVWADASSVGNVWTYIHLVGTTTMQTCAVGTVWTYVRTVTTVQTDFADSLQSF